MLIGFSYLNHVAFYSFLLFGHDLMFNSAVLIQINKQEEKFYREKVMFPSNAFLALFIA